MQYEAPAVEARFELSARLAATAPSNISPQPIWRSAKSAKPLQDDATAS